MALVHSSLHECQKALDYYKIVIDHINSILDTGDKTVVGPKFCDIYSEYVLLHVEEHMDLKKAKEDVEAFYATINKNLKQPFYYVIIMLASKARLFWIIQDFLGCLKVLRKLLKMYRKFKDQIGNNEVYPTDIQILYQIGKGNFSLFQITFQRSLHAFSFLFSSRKTPR